ncbi:hypothetical protein [Azohydromonas australica]|nr:hypothetical protein [Azohydromonas australica]
MKRYFHADSAALDQSKTDARAKRRLASRTIKVAIEVAIKPEFFFE